MDRPRDRKSKVFDGRAINAFIANLDAFSETLAEMSDPIAQPDFEDLEFQLDALTTNLLNAGLVAQKNLSRLKFHLAITRLLIPLPDRESLAESMKNFEDLISAYGDEPSSDEILEAIEIWETVTMALKKAFNEEATRNQLPLQ